MPPPSASRLGALGAVLAPEVALSTETLLVVMVSDPVANIPPPYAAAFTPYDPDPAMALFPVTLDETSEVEVALKIAPPDGIAAVAVIAGVHSYGTVLRKR